VTARTLDLLAIAARPAARLQGRRLPLDRDAVEFVAKL